jgi:hypothetical protein
LGRFSQAVKARVRSYVDQKKREAWHAQALQSEAKKEATAAYDDAFIKEKQRQARASARKAAQGGGGIRGALGTFATGFEGGVLGAGGKSAGKEGGLEVRVPEFALGGLGSIGPKRKKPKDIDDLLL